MELRHLRYVVAVAEHLHFGRAAERLHISQPPLSQQIRQLEDELGVTLFNRTKRQVQLTKAGEMLVDEARLIIAQVDHASRVATRVTEGDMGQLTIGIAGPADAPFFIDIFQRFAKRHPKVRIALRMMGTVEQARALHDGRIHVGFLIPPLDDPGLAVESVIHLPIVVALHRKHPLASRAAVPLRALASESHVMFSRDLDPHFFDAIVSACREAGFNLNVVHQVDDLYTACALVAAGCGVCFVPAGIQEGRSRAIVLKPLKPRLSHVDCHLALAYRQNPVCELVRLFVNVAKEVSSRYQNLTRYPVSLLEHARRHR
ncbi:MAG TPA: LysR substrate-binding domain-containing protein [Vicinamibacterales bacterium]|nr:LysR substrate-binding domain-containing protein [Vicinamibacterales bacterium]